jgi:uncharacterized protein (TIGR03000 family)
MGPGYSAGYQPGVTIGNPSSGLSVNFGYGPTWGPSGYSYAYPSYVVPSYTYVNPPYVAPSYARESAPTYANARPAATGGYEESSAQPTEASAANAARLTVRLPEGARLWLDDYESGQTGATRKFESPATLEPGHTYFYTLKAVWMQDGQEVVRTRRVDVQPNRDVFVDMTAPTQ